MLSAHQGRFLAGPANITPSLRVFEWPAELPDLGAAPFPCSPPAPLPNPGQSPPAGPRAPLPPLLRADILPEHNARRMFRNSLERNSGIVVRLPAAKGTDELGMNTRGRLASSPPLDLCTPFQSRMPCIVKNCETVFRFPRGF